MPTTFRPYQPDQLLMLPESLQDWLPEGHLSQHVSDLVDGLDLRVFYERYEGDGRRKSPYEPRMMVKVLIYGYATGVFSSRRLAKKLEEDVAFRVLGAGNFPSHRTVCEFRRRHLADFKRLFVEVVRLAGAMGLARIGTLSIDGTKVRANASKRKAMSYGRMVKEEKRLEAEIKALVGRAGAVDEEEDERYGVDVRGDELPEELKRREDRLEAIVEAKARLEARQRAMDDARGRKPGQDRNPKGGRPYKRAYGEPEAKAQSNFTDPQSRIMKTSTEGFQQCYNAQLAVEGENQLIVAAEVTSNASDQGQMLPRLRRGRGGLRGGSGDGIGGCGVLQRVGPGVFGGAWRGRLRGFGPGGQQSGGGQRQGASGAGADGQQAGDARRPGAVRQAQVAVGGAQRLDQAGAGFSPLQRARLEPSAGRVGPGVSGVEHEADARAGGGVKPGNSAPIRPAGGPIHRHSPPACGSMTPRGASEQETGCFIARRPPARPTETSYGARS